MNLNSLKTLGGPTVQRAALKISKYAPEILTGVGITGVIASTVLIARASTKLEGVVTDLEEAKAHVKDRELATDQSGELVYSEKEIQKDMVRVHIGGAMEFVKLYGPGVTLSIASIGSILAAHGIMQRRTVALLGAYKAIESAFATYRGRVIEEFGEEKDRDFRMGFRTETVENEETGKKKKVKLLDPNGISPYARFFDEGNENYQKHAEYNLAFLKNWQNYMNDMLRARGHVFLNEVYDVLGLERSSAGAAVGWVISKDGDNYIDFNIYNADSEKARDFVNGLERSILLDFNVDGVIIDLI